MSIRQRNLRALKAKGFRVAGSLPVRRSNQPTALRPLNEIASRLMALGCVFLWTTDWGENIDSGDLRAYLRMNRLKPFLTADDLDIIALDRLVARREYSYNIGWRLENMWALAWILGFEPSPALQGMISHPTIEALLEYLDIPATAVPDFVALSTPRSVGMVDEYEDLFYCAHNAVRSAQLGGSTVPTGFHPVADGGGIHERRHALTWALSPNVEWEDTDLST